MNQIHPCKDDSELTPLYPSRGLFLKPIARINVSVHYPELKASLSTGAKSVSSWDIMERIKALVAPETFVSLRVVKNTLEFIRFEGDLENRTVLKKIIQRLDGKTMKVTGFKELLKIRTGESKLPFPSKYDWDSFFRDAKNMNEMKAGERPDTIHFQNLPCKWFADGPTAGVDKPLPSERVFRRVWDGFGDVRAVDIPICDPFRSQMTTAIGGIKTFTFSNDSVFEAYVQYKDYISFVKAMDALRGCFLFYQETGKSWVANVKVDFDKSKHLGDESIKRRKTERERLQDKDKQKKNAEKLSRIEHAVQEKKNHEREKKESDKALAKIEFKIAMEERKYLIARRKLEAIRIMDYLFETVKRRILIKAEKRKLQARMKLKSEKESRKVDKAMEKYHRHNHHQRDRESDEALESDRRRRKSHRSEDEGSPSPPPSHRRRSEDEKERRSPRRRSASRNKDLRYSDHEDPELPQQNDEINKEKSVKVTSVRYLGDWEVKAKSTLGSQVQVSSNYVPVGASQPSRGDFSRGYPPSFRGRGRGGYRGRGGPYMNPHYPPHPNEFPEQDPGNYHHQQQPHHHSYPPRGRGSNPYHYYRGRGRGGYSNNYSHQSHPYNNHHSSNGEAISGGGMSNSGGHPRPQEVRHDFSYLDDLDRAYEKYFTSITKRHES